MTEPMTREEIEILRTAIEEFEREATLENGGCRVYNLLARRVLVDEERLLAEREGRTSTGLSL